MIVAWLITNSLYIMVLFCISAGAVMMEILVPPADKLRWFDRLIVRSVSVLLVAMLFAALVENSKWNIWLVCSGAIAVGMGSRQTAGWVVDFWKGSNTPVMALDKMRKVAIAAWTTWQSVNAPPPPSPPTKKDDE